VNPATLTYQRRLAALRNSAARSAVTAWDSLGAYDQAEADLFAPKAVRIVSAAQLLAGKTTAAYVSRVTSLRPPPITAADVTGTAARPVDPLDVYHRPFVGLWADLAEGKPYSDAVAASRAKLATLATTDVWLATRAATNVIDKALPQITYWVRRAGGGSCKACSAASGAILASAGELAGHPHCSCSAEPVVASRAVTVAVGHAANPAGFEVRQTAELGPTIY
jgi:hypothetical protein